MGLNFGELRKQASQAARDQAEKERLDSIEQARREDDYRRESARKRSIFVREQVDDLRKRLPTLLRDGANRGERTLYIESVNNYDHNAWVCDGLRKGLFGHGSHSKACLNDLLRAKWEMLENEGLRVYMEHTCIHTCVIHARF